jgi:hypothetical protein
MKALAIAVLALLSLVWVPSTVAKDFEPGDVRLCNATRCVPIGDRTVLDPLSRFYYSPGSPPQAHRPRLGAPAYELRYRNGY